MSTFAWFNFILILFFSVIAMGDEDGLVGSSDRWVLSGFAVYSTLLMVKFLFNILLIIFTRTRYRIVPNPEDVGLMRNADSKDVKVAGSHPLLSRAHRMLQNDLENIIPFFMLGFMYCITVETSTSIAMWHFRVFFICRMLHSISLYFGLQPFRTIFYTMALAVNIALGSQILYKAGLTVKYF